MPRALKPCSTPGCPTLVTSGRCGRCAGDADRQRGTPAERGYGRVHQLRFRPGVLEQHPTCQCELDDCGHLPVRCLSWSTVADHWPLGRDELVAAGLDPDDPQHGRGLCKRCHDRSTAQRQPGGWHRDAR